MSIYSFEPGPKYRPLTPQAAWDSALSSPLSLGTNFGEQVVGGALSSYVLGSTIRDTLIPQGNVERSPLQIIDALTPGIGMAKEAVRGLTQNFINPDQPSLSEDEWKASPSYRENIPYDPGMTAARADALAAWDDARKVREHFASKRPFSSFVGNLGGQALDPVNYVPVFGELVRAAALAKVGRIAGAALVASGDAAANTALAAAATYDTRGSFGDEVSWQGTISEIATAALIGGAFGTIGGAIGARSDARAVREATDRLATFNAAQEPRIAVGDGTQAIPLGVDARLSPNATEPLSRGQVNARAIQEATDRLSTLRVVQESRIALNEAIDGIVSGEDIRLSPNATEPMARVQQEIPKAVESAKTAAMTSPSEKVSYWAEPQDGTRQYFHGSPVADLTELRPSERGPMGPGVYLSSNTNVSDRYSVQKGGEGQRYVVNVPDDRIFHGDGVSNRSSDVNPYQVWRDQSKKVVDAADVADKPAIEEALKKAGADGGYQAYRMIAQHFKSDAKAQELFSRAGYDGISGYVDGPELVVFGKINLEPAKTAKPQVIDTSLARPDPIPEGRAKAETALAKAETYKATAEQYRVDPETGSYVEEAEIKQLDIEGRLTEQDKADLEAAAQIHENSVAYGDALKAAVNCLL